MSVLDVRLRNAAFAITLIALCVLDPSSPLAAKAPRLPRTMVWAWERPVDLRSAPKDFGIAFLAQTVTIDATGVAITSRRWPLKVSPDATLSSVTRVEMPVSRSLGDSEYARIVDAIALTAKYPRVAAVQIDFDATRSQRDLYRDLIARVRTRIGSAIPLSITALASWCVGDRWLDGLPVDEAVPMLFDMGPLNEPYRDIARNAKGVHPLCRSSLGVSLGEAVPLTGGGRRLYVFNPRPWSADALVAVREYAQR